MQEARKNTERIKNDTQGKENLIEANMKKVMGQQIMEEVEDRSQWMILIQQDTNRLLLPNTNKKTHPNIRTNAELKENTGNHTLENTPTGIIMRCNGLEIILSAYSARRKDI